MSRYADKRRARPTCAAPNCTDEATVLRVINARPDWFCDQCAQQLDKGTR